MKRKNRSHFFDDDELLVADILLQIPHIIFESESRLPFTWGFKRTRSDFDRSLSSHPKRKRTKLSFEKKKEDRLKMVDGLTHQREFIKSEIDNVTGLQNTLTALNSETKKKEDRLKTVDGWTHQREFLKSEIDNVTGCQNTLTALNSETKKEEDRLKRMGDLTHQRELLKSEIENVNGLHNTLTAVKSETKLNLVPAMDKAKSESEEQVNPHAQQPVAFLRRHSAETSGLVPSTSGSIVVYPVGPFVVMPHLNLSSSKESPPLNVAIYFDPTGSKRAAAAQARKKRRQIYRVKKTKAVQLPLSSLLVSG